jgi:hypothetical protein
VLKLPKTGRVFGVGLNKTGTTTLGHALNMLGIRTIDYPTDPRTLEQLERGDYKLDILNEYAGVTDTPVGFFYPQLDKLYPGSRFILTVRDKPAWLRSVRDHWPFVMDWGRHEENFRRFTYYAFIAVYGALHFNEDRYSYVYDSYVAGVKDYFQHRPDDLLVMDICAGDGWEALCPFLNVAIPDQPFPFLNRREDKLEPRRWVDRLDQAVAELDALVPRDAAVIVVDEDKLANSAIHRARTVLPFRERDGVYNGPPRDDRDAIAELDRLREAGAEYIAFAWPSFWWLEHYVDFTSHLRERFRCVMENQRWVVFQLPKL